MKKIFSFVALVAMLSTFSLISCDENDSSAYNTNASAPKFQKSGGGEEEKELSFHIYFNNWDGDWGRDKHDCKKGWGFCKATICWFCCTDAQENVVDCQTGEIVSKTRTVIIDPISNKGYLDVELNPSDDLEAKAIAEAAPFYIDKDIDVSGTLILHEGEYQFDASIGQYGGYKVIASKQ